jgi:hypothetical protein
MSPFDLLSTARAQQSVTSGDSSAALIEDMQGAIGGSRYGSL